MSPRDPDDAIALLFEEAHRAGDHMGIRFGRFERAEDAATGTPEWLYMPHWRYDGIGGFGQLLRERGVLGLDRLPELKRARPGTLVELRASARHALRMSTARAWKQLDAAACAEVPERSRCANAIAFRLLDRKPTAQLAERARSRSSSLNSLLLWALDRTAREAWLAKGMADTQWMVPVNLRGAVRLGRDTANHLSFIDLDIPSWATAGDVHSKLRSELEQGAHWGTWRFIQLSGKLGRGAARSLVQKEVARGLVHAGMFSNLGEWGSGLADDAPEGRAAWVFAPQTTRKVPVSAGALVWRGRLALALQAHPVLGATNEDVARWLDRWITLVES